MSAGTAVLRLVGVWVALLRLLALTVISAFMPLGEINLVLTLLIATGRHCSSCSPSCTSAPAPPASAYLREDVGALLRESQDGVTRVKQIVVQGLKDFSRFDGSEWQFADLNRKPPQHA